MDDDRTDRRFTGRIADLVADLFISVARAAEPQAKLLGGAARGVAVLGLVGGLVGAAGIALPGIGLAPSPLGFWVLAAIAVVPAVVVWRWGTALRNWSGDVAVAANSLRRVGDADAQVGSALGSVAGALRSARGGPGSAVLRLVRGGRQLWRVRATVQGVPALVAGLTGPFRPPLVGWRFACLAGGMVMIGLGPLVALVALVV